MCQLAGVSRVSFYRSLQERAPVKEDMEVRSVMQRIAVEHRRRYGYRRMSAELRRRGMVVNHKRVLRMMREDNLLAVQPRAFVATTDSAHEFEVYQNLASRMKLTGMNQLRVADITYVRLQKEFVYVAKTTELHVYQFPNCLNRRVHPNILLPISPERTLEDWSGREDLNLRPPGPEVRSLVCN
jgi:hypothetical protein